jgi:predicted pyridoxine 5'-phosphate oxidase superfamily flavin-nucleotide-binding protein
LTIGLPDAIAGGDVRRRWSRRHPNPKENDIVGHRYAEIAFTPTVKAVQEREGSRHAYRRLEASPEPANHALGKRETAFIAARDSFYMATVGETGWPYVQHRGGPPGFVRVLDAQMIGFADFRGNRQYVSLGNLATDDRVALFFMDYPNRARLKLFGRARILGPDDAVTTETLALPDYKARVERGILIVVAAFDWNCPQHITPRFTIPELNNIIRRP